MNILYIVPYAPTIIRTRPYHLIRALRQRGHRVTVGTLWEEDSEREELEEFTRDYDIQLVASHLGKLRIAGNISRGLLTNVPLQARYCWESRLLNKIKNALHKERFDIVHIEHLRGAAYGLALRSMARQSELNLPILWDSVDCISLLFEQAVQYSRSRLGRWMARFDLRRTRAYEGWLVKQFDRVIVTSTRDRQALERLVVEEEKKHFSKENQSTDPQIQVLSNGVDLEGFTPGDLIRRPNTVVFSGKLSYHANVSAALYLVEEILPRVWEKRPNVQTWLVGKNPPADIQRLAHDPRVKVIGTVPDLQIYLRQASVAIAPLTYGVGIQNKILEAMACCTPVVANSLGTSALAALPGQDLLVGDSTVELAQAILSLLEDERLCCQIGKNGRNFVEQNHNWDAIASRLEGMYLEITEVKKRG